MAGIDKAAIGFTLAIVAIGVGFAFYGDSIQGLPSTSPAPVTPSAPSTPMETSEPGPQTDPFADLAAEVRNQSDEVVEETMMEEEVVEETMMEEEVVEETMMEEEVVEETMMEEEVVEETMMEEEVMMKPTGPQTHTVDMPEGTSVPGCEETNACYLPADITINAGDTVEWINVDTAAHTVTGGSPADGPSGVFDSSLVMGGAVYAFTFEETGSYDYFCMVHPWMVGSVTVTEGAMIEETMMEEEVVEETMMEEEVVEEMVAEEPTGPQTHTVDMPEGTSVPGCEETNACYLPADITINAGDTVEWINVDTAAHTVTGGSPADGPSGVFDSSLVMGGAVYAFTFEETGSYDYFCMVHPWMVGSVTVN